MYHQRGSASFRPCASALAPRSKLPLSKYSTPGPVRQKAFFVNVSRIFSGVGVLLGSDVVVGVEVESMAVAVGVVDTTVCVGAGGKPGSFVGALHPETMIISNANTG